MALALVLVAGCGGESRGVSGGAGGDRIVGPPDVQGPVVGGQTASVETFMRNVARDVDSFWRAALPAKRIRYISPKLYILRPGQRLKPVCLDEPFSGTTENAFWCAIDLRLIPAAKPS